MKKILILGSSGTLGGYLSKSFAKKNIIIHNGLKKKNLNLLNLKYLESLIKKKPDVIINCIALTDIEYCESHKKKAFNVNVKISRNIFQIKKKYNLNFKYIFISTDQLYDNNFQSSEKSKVKINNFYTKTKFAAEKVVKKNHGIILRTNFFGKTHNKKTFTDWILEKFTTNKKSFYLINDVYFSPVRIYTLGRAIGRLINQFPNKAEIFNIGSSTSLNKEKFAIKFAKKMKIYKKNYISIKYKELLNVKRSNNMSMCSKKFQKYFNFRINSLEKEIINEAKNY